MFKEDKASCREIKIIDFGLSAKVRHHDEKDLHDLVGSPYYVAPEIVARKYYDSKVDLWSCGVILYEIM